MYRRIDLVFSFVVFSLPLNASSWEGSWSGTAEMMHSHSAESYDCAADIRIAFHEPDRLQVVLPWCSSSSHMELVSYEFKVLFSSLYPIWDENPRIENRIGHISGSPIGDYKATVISYQAGEDWSGSYYDRFVIGTGDIDARLTVNATSIAPGLIGFWSLVGYMEPDSITVIEQE